MHVLVVTTVHVPTDARILHREVRALLRAGHRVTVAGPWSATGSTPPDDVTAVDLPRASGRRRLGPLLAARRLLRRPPGDVDLALVHDPELLLAVALARPRRPVVWDVHEDLGASLGDKAWLPPAARRGTGLVVRAVERWAERRVHLVLAEDAYAARFRGSHPVAHNLPWLRPLPTGQPARRVVYVGRVSAGRGAHDLLQLGRFLQPDDVEVAVVGPADPDVRGLLEQADRQGTVRWHGYLSNPEALEVVQGAVAGLSLLHDVPNYRHSMPTKVLEYMERGLPVVTTPLPLARAVVQEHRCGTVVPFRDPAAVADAVRALLADPAEQQRQAARARSAARDHFSWDGEAARFVAALEAWAGAQTR